MPAVSPFLPELPLQSPIWNFPRDQAGCGTDVVSVLEQGQGRQTEILPWEIQRRKVTQTFESETEKIVSELEEREKS